MYLNFKPFLMMEGREKRKNWEGKKNKAYSDFIYKAQPLESP